MTATMTADAVLEQLAREIDVPTHFKPQAQGDIGVFAAEVAPATEPIPADGIELVRGDGGHAHLLLGRVLWAPSDCETNTLGVVTVPAGEVGYLAHGDGTPQSALDREARHDLVAFPAGTYVIRRQREEAELAQVRAD